MNKNLPDGDERAGNSGRVNNMLRRPRIVNGCVLLVGNSEKLSEVGEKGDGWGRVKGDDIGKNQVGPIAKHLLSDAFKELRLDFVGNRTQLTFFSRRVT